jgi:hypothetical protein
MSGAGSYAWCAFQFLPRPLKAGEMNLSDFIQADDVPEF